MNPLILLTPDDLLKIVLAVLAGALIGAEREYRFKTAGFRTMTLITLGSTLFTLLSIKLGGPADPARIAAQIVTGIGFLGAGAILRGDHGVTGLTTAAAIWAAAAIGMAIGSDLYLFAMAGVLAILVVLLVFPYIERYFDRVRLVRDYDLVVNMDAATLERMETVFKQSGLRLLAHKRLKVNGRLSCQWLTTGAPHKHTLLVEQLLQDPSVVELKY